MSLDAISEAIGNSFNLNSRSNRRYPSMSTRRALPRRSNSSSPNIAFTTAICSTTDATTNLHKNSSKNLTSNGDPVSSPGNIVNGKVVNDFGGIVGKNSLNKKIDWEIPRKTLHSSIGFIVLPLYLAHVSPVRVVYCLVAALAVIVPADIVRLRQPAFARLYESVVGFLMRDSEKEKSNGVIWYLLGVSFVLTFYPTEVAVVSILILSWCDTTASVFGRMYGPYTAPLPQNIPIPFSSSRIPIPFARRKSLAGFLGASATGFLIATAFWGWIVPLANTRITCPTTNLDYTLCASGRFTLFITGIAVGLISGVAEALDIVSLDDNFTLPIISGGVIWVLLKCFSWINLL